MSSEVWLKQARRLVFDHNSQYLNQASVDALRTYLTGYDGRYFEQLTDQSSPDRFTPTDLLALNALSVSVPPSAASWILRTNGRAETGALLSDIDSTMYMEDVPHTEFDALLGERSAAWALWDLLHQQRGIGSTIAGKLLAAKRPRLIPISDEYVKDALGTSERDLWKCMWTVLTDEEIQAGLKKLRHEVSEAKELPLLRVMDVVAWMAERHRGDGI